MAISRLNPHNREMNHKTAGLPDTATFEKLARRAMRGLPPAFREHLGDIVVRVEEFAPAATLQELGLTSRWELTGLYQGHPMSHQSIWSSGELPPVITLYRAPLLREWAETGVALKDLVNHVVVHEVGHHFGLSDEEMAAIEDGAA